MSAETPETTGLRDRQCWRGECRSACAYEPNCSEKGLTLPEAVRTVEPKCDALPTAEKAEAERDRLARWKAEALPVLDGLQEIGKALDLQPGAWITGPQALEAIEALQAERDRLAAAVERVQALVKGPHTLINDCGMSVRWVDPDELRSALSDAGGSDG